MTKTRVMPDTQETVVAVKRPIPPQLQVGKSRHLGIHGARGTGKTCYLACLYGQRASEQAGITFSDDHSIDHLQAAWKVLERGEVPDATALTLPTELHMGLHADGLTWNVTTRDYAGALVQRSETGVPELKEEVKQWLVNCHAILLFVNSDARAITERHDELDLLITELKKLSPGGNAIGRPLALLLTKWDTLEEPGHDRQRVLEHLQSRPELKQIADALQSCGDRIEVFPVSAFGSHREGNKPPLGGPRPIGLREPLVWAVQKADEMLLERARRNAETGVGARVPIWKRLWRWNPYLTNAVSCFRTLINEEGVNKGPIHENARKELQGWRTKLYKWRACQGAVALVTALVLVTGSLLWLDKWGHERALAALTDAAAAPNAVKDECERYLAGWNPAARWSGHRDDIVGKWRAYRENRETQEYEALDAYRQKNHADEEADKCHEQDEGFLKRWPGSEHASKVEGWERDDGARVKQHQENIKLESEYHGLLERLARMEGKYDKLMAECDKFLHDFPKAGYPKKAHLFDEVQKSRDGFEKAKNERDWEEVINYERQNPRNFKEIIKKTVSYANKPTARYCKEAQHKIASTEDRWDRTEYEKVRGAAREAKDYDSIVAAEKAARDYVNGDQPRKRGETAVKEWLKWVEGLKEEKEYYFTIKSLLVPEGSNLDCGKDRETRIYGRFGESAFEAGWEKGIYGNNPQIDEMMGPVRFKLGQAATLEFTVEKWNYFGSNYKATGKDENNLFLLGKLNETFIVTCAKQKSVEIRLECPAAVPPKLDSYPER